MTRVVWGDPLKCHYTWIEPGRLEEYGDALRHVGRKVAVAMTSLEVSTTLPEAAFAGAAAETLRARAGRRAQEAAAVRDNLHSVGHALREHARTLERYREALGGLRQLAATRGLEIRDQQIWAPTCSLPPGAGQPQYDAWVSAWRSYQACFELKTDLELERRERSLELARTVTDCTGVRPDPDRGKQVPTGHGSVGFGQQPDDDVRQRRRAADGARRALQAQESVAESLAGLDRLRQRHEAALSELHLLATTNASEDELTAQAGEVRIAAETLRAARLEATKRETSLRQAMEEARIS